MASNLSRFKNPKPEEQDAIEKSLNIFETLMEIEPLKISEYLFNKTELLDWIFLKLRTQTEFTTSTFHASEILSIICSKSEKTQKAFGPRGGIKVLLLAVAGNKATKKTDMERVEFLENLFDCLCSVLIQPESKELFA